MKSVHFWLVLTSFLEQVLSAVQLIENHCQLVAIVNGQLPLPQLAIEMIHNASQSSPGLLLLDQTAWKNLSSQRRSRSSCVNFLISLNMEPPKPQFIIDLLNHPYFQLAENVVLVEAATAAFRVKNDDNLTCEASKQISLLFPPPAVKFHSLSSHNVMER